MSYSAWGHDGIADTLVLGNDRPRFVDGTEQDPTCELIWTIEAESWESALEKYHILQGWKVPERSEND